MSALRCVGRKAAGEPTRGDPGLTTDVALVLTVLLPSLVAGGVFFWSRHGGGGGAGVADDKKAQAGARPVPVLLATVAPARAG